MTEMFAGDQSPGQALNLERPGGIHVPATSEALVKVGLADSGQLRDAFALLKAQRRFDGYGDCHDPDCSDPLRYAQGVLAKVRVKTRFRGYTEVIKSGAMETAGERRRRKLRLLCEKYGRDEVAARSNVNPFALDQVIKGVLLPPKRDGTRSPRNLGDVAARTIERALDLPEGWFDAPEEAQQLSPEALTVALAFEKMTEAERTRLLHLMAAALDTVLLDPPDETGGVSAFDAEDERRQG